MAITHLNLNQTTSSIEVVSSTIIDKLYELAQTNLDETSNVQGNLQVVHAYEDAVTYLLNKYPNLQINVTSGAYIRFADSAVQAICGANWGDGIGITVAQVTAVASLNLKFKANTSIGSFNELYKFINVKTIAYQDFLNCTNLVSIDLSNITTINNEAFNGCTKLVNIVSLQNLVTIGQAAFYNCPITGELSVPNLTGIVRGFAYTKITKVLNLGSCTTMNWSDSFHYGYSAFSGCSELIEITLPDTMLSIGGMSACPKLTKVNFNNNVNYIYQTAFKDDILLTSVGDCSNVTKVEQNAFNGCRALLSINLTEVCKSILSSAFKYCTALTSVGDLSGVTTTTGDSQFNGCVSLTSIKFGALTIIPQNMFDGCVSLTTVTGANAFTAIKQYAFQNCTSLSTIDLNSLLSCTEYGVFKGCTNLVSVTNFKSISVGQSMFDTCSKLATIDLSSTQVFNSNAFSNCLLLANINSLSAATNIKSGVFNHTSLAIELNLPNIVELGVNAFGYSKITKITNLGSLAILGTTSGDVTWGPFNNCTSLVSVVLPSTLSYIHDATFMNCTALLYVVCNATTPPTLSGTSAFQNTTCKIYVPDDSVTAYKAATNWSTYASRIFSLTQFATDFPNG